MLNKILQQRVFNRFKKKIYIDVQYGLGNRMRAYACAQQLADRAGRHCILVWIPDNHCECRFSDLFTNKIDIIESIDEVDLSKCDIYNYMDGEEGAIKDKYIDHTSVKDVYIKSAFELNQKFMNWWEVDKIFKKLKYTDEITTEINKYDVRKCVGVHVRMEGGANLDGHSYDRSENWGEKGRRALHKWREESHYSIFMKKMNKLLKDDPDQMFFLCTDMQRTYDMFIQKYGSSILYVEREHFDRSVDQIKSALIDMVLLSRTKYVLGSNFSSFTSMAKHLGGRKLLLAGIDF